MSTETEQEKLADEVASILAESNAFAAESNLYPQEQITKLVAAFEQKAQNFSLAANNHPLNYKDPTTQRALAHHDYLKAIHFNTGEI